MPTNLESKRAQLVAGLKNLPPHMQRRLQELKSNAEKLRKRPDLLWYLLLQSAATQGNTSGWVRLREDSETLDSLDYSELVKLDGDKREKKILTAFQKAG